MSNRYNKDFHLELEWLVADLKPRFSLEQLAAVLHVSKSNLYKWVNGRSTPIWLARQATISILRALAETTLRS